MERSDRTPTLSGGASVGTFLGGAPGGAAVPQSQSATIRGPPENPPITQSRRPSISATNAPLPPIPMPPLPNARNAALPPLPNAAQTPANPMTSSQVIGLVQDAMRHALESEGQAVEASGIGPGLKSGVTIDLSRKGIHKLPEEVIDIVKNELERLALSHNQLSSLPARFVECTSLRYLNIRGNYIKEFPMPLCELSSLEILDLGRNQLRSLPPELSKLSSLKVLSIPKNQIRELPLCIADMLSLQVIKFEGNPISFPPREVLHPSSARAANDATIRESDVNEIAVTAHIKKFLRLHAINGRDSETAGDDSSEGAETPRMPKKRLMSGRFPIRVNGTDKPDVRSPGLGIRPPPIPSRSHYRGHSQQNNAAKRPGVLPLTIGNLSERYRSNSESLLRFEKSESRQRRMGVVPKKSSSDLTPLDETAANNRFSHYRGLSDGSAMQGGAAPAKSPATPTTESSMQRPIYVRRLSVLPERRRESSTFDPVIEAAKGILYSVFQIHPMIQMLMTLTNDGSSKRSSLELVFYNTNSHVEELEQAIQKHDTPNQESDEPPSRDNANVHRACQTLVGAYGHVCTLLADNIETFVSNGDARYIRTLLMLIYNSIMELRVTLSSVSSQQQKAASPMQSPAQDNSNTIRPYFREASAAHRPVNSRGRNGNVTYTPFTKAMAEMSAPCRPPRSSSQSNDAGTPPSSRDTHADVSDEDAQFDKIYLSLQASTDVVMQILPNFGVQLTGGIRNAMQQRAPAALIRDWRTLIALCNDTVQQTEVLKNQMSLIRLRDPSVKAQGSFWNLCSNFVASWTRMAYKIKAEINTIPLPPDTRMRLRPIHQSMKETSNTILQSPWHNLFRPTGPIGSAQGPFGQIMSPNQMSITPQSAALGPAMQATVATPQNASFASAFQGNVFDRADTLIANPGISMSRTGTMTRGHSGFNSLSSISSVSSDGVPTPSSAFSPSPAVQLGPTPFRLNGGKVAI
ncbi:Leucine-rich repeat-containing protein sog2 [Escovopsis weberi]|uniref:Leucine-rich repeat-containing protein sog2 n=1 Tax=Escovopsis weberi TaxID=150374 RepID=A0A0M8MY95_ESCWE|nr:Leucine-rich repeat-containing protein sog2 [Escovopsis weberi]